jgi:site-specific DNA recombinase
MKKAIELIRVSTEQQAADDRASIPAQHETNKRTASNNGLTIVRSIQFSDVSGASVLQAPEIQELIRLIQSPDIHGVVTREFSRLMRPDDLGDYGLLQVFVNTKTVLYLADGPIDLASKHGKLLGVFKAAMAGADRTESLERIWTAKEVKRRRGELAQSEIVLPHFVGYDKTRGFFYEPDSERVREAYRQFLAGNQNYVQLAEMVGVTPRGMHLILRNPIWTGFRVIDKKRDTSPAGRYPSVNGRQSDRRKIPRAPDEVIRVRVIEEPLISDEVFQSVQRMMDLKQKKHWRTRPGYEHRFTYNGYLTCPCGEPIHTANARRDYYTCRGRTIARVCDKKYMARQKLEPILDTLFSERLVSPDFLERCIHELKRRSESNESALRMRHLTSEIERLGKKHARVIEAFLDGVIPREERDERLATIDRETKVAKELLAKEEPPVSLDDVSALTKALAPLAEWRYWSREQKRTLLATLVPDIRVADYKIESLGLNPVIFSNENTHSGTGSSPLPA